MPLTPNQLLYEYRIERILGQGAFGVVYLAHDTLLDRPVAIKELTITRQTDETAFKRFLQEARAAGNLNHPHIVTVYALKVVEPTVYLVMECLAGGSLRTLLEQRGALPVEDAVRIVTDVCEGLAAAHAKGIVHRDVKPENILLTANGQAKIGDFGIAHVPRGTGGTYLSRLTGTGFQPGTLIYMSPEQIRGQPLDGRSDVYQVGALLYEMLTRRHYIDMRALERQARDTAGSNAALFQARLLELLSEAVCEREPADVCAVRPDVPEWVGEAVAAALAKRAKGRPQAKELARGLRQTSTETQPAPMVSPDRTHAALAEEHFNRGMSYYSQGHLNEAIQEFQAVVRVNPGDAGAHNNLGMAYAGKGRWDEAILEYQIALRIDPNYAGVHFNLGVAYAKQGCWDEAILEYQATLRLNLNGANVHYNLGFAYAQQGRWDEAIHEYQATLHINPNDAVAHHGLGVVYAEQSCLDEAILEYQAALRIDPNLKQAHLNLGAAYGNQGHLDKAIREFQAALCMNPNDAVAHYGLGVAYEEQGCRDEAICEYQAALRIDPNDAMVHYGLAQIYAKQGRWDEAIHEYQAALHINPNDAVAHHDLGVAYTERSRSDEAILEYQAALCIDPSLAQAHYVNQRP